MAQCVCRIFKGEWDAMLRSTGPVLTRDDGTILMATTLSNTDYALLQFRWPFPAGTITKAVLRLRAAANAAATTTQLLVEVLTRRTEFDTGTTFSVASSQTVTLSEWVAGNAYEIDITTAIQGVAVPFSDLTDFVSLRLSVVNGGDDREIYAWDNDDLGFEFSAELVLQSDVDTGRVTDPYTLVHLALWAMLESSYEFGRLVLPANRIKYTDLLNRNPSKREAMTSDFPEVRIVAAGGNAAHFVSTHSGKFGAVYEVQIATGDQRLAVALGPVQWAVARALTRYREVLLSLRWKGSPGFVTSVGPATIQQALVDHERPDGVRGWASVWSCEVHMYFALSDLTAPWLP